MSEIKKGDLVMVVRPTPCCGNSDCIGLVYRVKKICSPKNAGCLICKKRRSILIAYKRDAGGYDVKRLIKIDPPALHESTETSESLTA